MTAAAQGDAAVREMLAAYRAAAHARDVDALAALYADDVRVFDLWGGWSCEGRAAWRAVIADWLGGLGSERVEVEFDEVRSDVVGAMAVASAFVTYRGVSAEGAPLRAMQNRLTWALVRRPGGAWQVVHEHTSAPVDHASGNVVLKRG